MGGIPTMETIQSLIFLTNMFIGASMLINLTSAVTMVFILLLGVYSGLEGIAIGVADTEANAWKSLWNVSLLKMVAAVTMGTGLFKLLPQRPYLASVVYLCAYFVSTPTGVAIGTRMDAATQAHVTDWIGAITYGSIGGIYVYDATLRVLSRDDNRLKPSFLGGCAYVVLGVVGMMVAVSILVSYYDQ